MKFLIACFFGIISCWSLVAHEPNVAFFKYVETETTIEVHAEFPWTLRNALLIFNPNLEHAISREEFERTLLSYIKTHLILKDENGKPLQLIDMSEVQNKQHSHQNNFVFIFQGTELKEVSNTVMFDHNENQSNYNTFETLTSKTTFKTTKTNSGFKLERNHSFNYLYLLVLAIPIGWFVIRKTSRS